MAHKFNDIDVRTPTSFSWDMEPIETSEKPTADGKDHTKIIAYKRKLEYEWQDPKKEEVSTILLLINQTRFVSVTYPDAMSNTYETREFKVVKRSAPFRSLRVGARLYETLSLSFEER